VWCFIPTLAVLVGHFKTEQGDLVVFGMNWRMDGMYFLCESPASVSSGGAGMDAGLDDAVENCGGGRLGA